MQKETLTISGITKAAKTVSKDSIVFLGTACLLCRWGNWVEKWLPCDPWEGNKDKASVAFSSIMCSTLPCEKMSNNSENGSDSATSLQYKAGKWREEGGNNLHESRVVSLDASCLEWPECFSTEWHQVNADVGRVSTMNKTSTRPFCVGSSCDGMAPDVVGRNSPDYSQSSLCFCKANKIGEWD